MKKLTKYDLYKIFVEDSEHPFSGWDFSYIKDRLVTEPLTWSYSSIIIPYIRSVNSLLDMGTGGGEFLSNLQPFPSETYASENYPPNYPIAKAKLEPLGVKVISFEEKGEMPFEDNQLELIINRHEYYQPEELFRIMKKGALFITQQVGDQNDLEINESLGLKKENLQWNLQYAVHQLEKVGFEILTQKECFPKSYCFDIGALIYYLKIIPWQVPNFSIEKFRTKLKDIHLHIQEKDWLELTSHRFLIVARKPK